MKIWTISTDTDDGGISTAAYADESEARAHFARIVAACWESWFRKPSEPMPEDATEAWQILQDQMGFMETLTIQAHEIEPPFSDRETATLLAALRAWQASTGTATREQDHIATDGGTLDPLSDAEIDALCIAINTGCEADRSF